MGERETSAIDDILSKISKVESAIRPYQGMAAEADLVINNLAQIRSLLQEPSVESLDEVSKKLDECERAAAPYRSMPEVSNLLEMLKSAREDLARAKREL